ncbi:MAG: hypothetical protein IKX00_03455 [Bacilli bacterium]|nr:hypothetical protein [Bacilli bacterium]
MGKIYETLTEPLEYKDVAKDVFNFYNELLELYMEILEKYRKVATALDEVDLLEDVDLDKYLLAQGKINYFMQVMPPLFDEERRLFSENDWLMPFLYQHIEKRFKLKGILNLNTFSAFDPLIYKKYESIKGNYPIIRMIRAIKFYAIFNDVHTTLVDLHNLDYTDEDILNDISLDYSDIESVNTINQLIESFPSEEDTHMVNSYKCLLMFCNPCTEYKYFSLKFNDFCFETHNEVDEAEKLAPVIKTIKSKTTNTILAIQHSPVINYHKRGRLIYEPKSDDPKVLGEYYKNKNELYLLYAYALQSYPYYSLESIQDFDHLFTLMSRYNGKDYNDIRLSKRVVDYFFRKDAYNNPLFSQRVRKDN